MANLRNGLDSVQVVDTRVQTNLVHDSDTSLLAVLVQLHHGRGDVRGRDNVLLGTDGRLDNQGVESVGDQGYGDIVLRESLVEGVVIADVEGDGCGVLEAFAELLGALEGSTGCS